MHLLAIYILSVWWYYWCMYNSHSEWHLPTQCSVWRWHHKLHVSFVPWSILISTLLTGVIIIITDWVAVWKGQPRGKTWTSIQITMSSLVLETHLKVKPLASFYRISNQYQFLLQHPKVEDSPTTRRPLQLVSLGSILFETILLFWT